MNIFRLQFLPKNNSDGARDDGEFSSFFFVQFSPWIVFHSLSAMQCSLQQQAKTSNSVWQNEKKKPV